MSSKEQKPRQSTRGALLAGFVASARLQDQGVQQSIGQVPGEGAQAGQGARFTVQDAFGRIDEMRMRLRAQTGWTPGLVAERRAARRSEVLTAVSAPKTVIVENPGPKQENPPTPLPVKSMFTCPWSDAGCAFTTDSPDALKTHVAVHTRAVIRTY